MTSEDAASRIASMCRAVPVSYTHLDVYKRQMEQHMGCGTGGCATCVCKIGGEYKKVCTQGPVFDIREVDALYE